MAVDYKGLLKDRAVVAALKAAWQESQPDVSGGHEEGGFVLRNTNGEIEVLRWVTGAQNSIRVPPHPGCKIGASDILASFHTHPNTGSDYLQEPSETDKRAVRHDPDLKEVFYVGEFIISDRLIYLIQPDGYVIEVGRREAIVEGV